MPENLENNTNPSPDIYMKKYPWWDSEKWEYNPYKNSTLDRWEEKWEARDKIKGNTKSGLDDLKVNCPSLLDPSIDMCYKDENWDLIVVSDDDWASADIPEK